MSKYNEYRLKAQQLDNLVELLRLKHWTVQTIRLGDCEYRMFRQEDGTVKLEQKDAA
ncbi:hypothetical protein [Mesorhizobium sp.]|uniref:hypothetical protein n=1 Tax=Mesorhizobium sp. TaxID=1871066 RepID=UPI00257DE381|nr:hypothetical protein [Mesorhizobium sp.]